jgi:hypothetical protein
MTKPFWMAKAARALSLLLPGRIPLAPFGEVVRREVLPLMAKPITPLSFAGSSARANYFSSGRSIRSKSEFDPWRHMAMG